ncbi:FMR1N protein, partial [Jacana jacana]|nr:FMR1N protein [Jacana jacana]
GTQLAWSCGLLVLLYSINPSFASPTEHVLEKSEVASSNFSIKLKDVYESLSVFFKPVRCDHLDKRILIPCHVGELLNITECLTKKCCPSKTSHELTCYMPLLDKMQMMFRVLVFVAGGLLILGCLPLCSCACLHKSHCLNPLRRPNKKLAKIMWKKKAQRDEAYGPL